jgi:DNA sulfur modification protein DndC
VLTTQETVRQLAPPDMKDIELISHDELLAIRHIWREEKHEFDDALPRIYHEVTGQKFQDPRPNAYTTLGPDEWATLETLCGDNAMYLELVARLLDTERKYQTMSRRTGIYKALEGCFESSGLAKEPAIQRAETIRELKDAEREGDVEVFQNAWAALKFGNRRLNHLQVLTPATTDSEHGALSIKPSRISKASRPTPYPCGVI